MKGQRELKLVTGRGVDADRYMNERGFYSDRPEEGRQFTLFEIETLEALRRDHAIILMPEEHRRNITTRGAAVNHLVGKKFWVGNAQLKGTRLSTPCRHIEQITGKEIFNFLLNRSGLHALILEGSVVRVGDPILARED